MASVAIAALYIHPSFAAVAAAAVAAACVSFLEEQEEQQKQQTATGKETGVPYRRFS